ncbi:MAG: DUF4202 domain-containing protein [Opitutales bacterium]|nr:DUF4202 domain-containing protein [Opitutales bacterium]
MSEPQNPLFAKAIAAIDECNAKDPNMIEVDGEFFPRELYESHARTRWLEVLYPDADETVQLASRGQHICRWEIPRDSYPEGRAAYLKWREDLKKFHAKKVGEILIEAGYDQSTTRRVKDLNLKKNLKKDGGTQAVEDVLCMVFLELQFDEYVQQWEEQKTVRILQKTWSKMSERAQKAALGLNLSPLSQKRLSQALEG